MRVSSNGHRVHHHDSEEGKECPPFIEMIRSVRVLSESSSNDEAG